MPTPTVYPAFKLKQHNGNGGDLDAASAVKVGIVTTGGAYNSAHTNWTDVSASEVSGTNYTAGGVAVANPTAVLDGTVLEYAHDDVVWSQHASGFINGRSFVWYFVATGNLIMHMADSADFGNVAGPLTLDGSAATGVLQAS